MVKIIIDRIVNVMIKMLGNESSMEFYLYLLGFGTQSTFPTCAVHDLAYYFRYIYSPYNRLGR